MALQADGRGRKRLASFLSFAALAPLLASRVKRPDVLFVESPPIFTGLAGMFLHRLWDCTMVVNIADLYPDAAVDLGVMREGSATWAALARLEERLYRQADFVTAVAFGTRNTLITKKGLPRDKVLFLPNGADPSQFRPADPDPELARALGVDGRDVVLYAGTHGLVHGLETVLDAAEILRDRNAVFLFVGGGSDKKRIVELARSRGLDNVVFADPVPFEQVPAVHALAKVALAPCKDLPVFARTRSAKIFAAMGCEVPLVCSAPGETADVVERTGAGLCTPPEDGAAMARAIATLLDDPERARAMGRAGRRAVVERLNWSALVGRWLEHLERGQGPTDEELA